MEHYVLPIVPLLLVLVALGAQRLAAMWKEPVAHRKAELVVTAALIVVAVASLPELNPLVRDDRIFAPTGTILRQAIRERVQPPAIVLVHTDHAQNPHDEPVYNDGVAWPDDAPVIIAHDLGPRNLELIDYYERKDPGRRYYLFNRDRFSLQGPGTGADLARAVAAAAKNVSATTQATTNPSE
jgi:hypothetical protein